MAFDVQITCQIDLFIKVMAPMTLHCLDRQKWESQAWEVRKYTPMIGNNGLAMSSNTRWPINIKTNVKYLNFWDASRQKNKTLRSWNRPLVKPCVRTQILSSRDVGSCVREIPENWTENRALREARGDWNLI